MNYTEAMIAARRGMVVRRTAWPFGTCVVYQSGSVIHPEQARNDGLKRLGSIVRVCQHYDLAAKRRGIYELTVGWKAQRHDAAATDWEVME
jgi:hypothetical protein